MRDHKDNQHSPVGHGGKARLRHNAFQEARGITDATASQYSSVYTAGVLQAIALAAAPGAPAPASLPQWRLLGPDLVANGQTWAERPDGTWIETSVSGRVSAAAVDPKNSNHILCGAAGGGIWESFNKGASWAPRTDFMPTLAIGAIAFDPNSSLTVYAGTGEGNSYWFLGQGLLRSTDGGTTWTMRATAPFVGNGFFQIIVDPASSSHILAATYKGLYESTDSGSTWAQVIATCTWDISMQPGGGSTSEVLAATSGGLQASADGGHTWTATAVALPNAPAGWTRLGVSIAPADRTIAYAYGASTESPSVAYLWRRLGGTWTAVTLPAGDLGTKQASYDWYVEAARDRTDQIYIGGFDVFRGDLSGTTWTWINVASKPTGDSIHPDHHALVFDPNDASTIYCGCDGGLFRSPDRGVTWIPLNAGLATYEMEYAAQDNASSRWLLAGLQDNGSLRFAGTSAFEQVFKGDGGDCGVDQTHPDICYVSYTEMGVYKSTQKGIDNSFAAIDATKVMGVPANYGTLFYPPMGVAGSTVAQAGQSVFISRDAGAAWTEVTLPAANPPSTPNITALYVSTTDLIYAGAGNGRVFSITYSATANPPGWSIAELASPRAAYVSAIRVDSSSRIWVTMSEVGGGRVWRSADSGATWTDLTGSLPGFPINSIAFDPNTAGRVWLAADLGVYQSLDSGATWATFFRGLPNALVTDLEFHNGDRLLRAATRNRGIWEAAVDKAGNSALAPRVQACMPVLNRTGGYEFFAVGVGGTPYHIWQNGPTTGWYGWVALGSGAVVSSSLVAALNTDGRNEVFARGMDGALWHNYHVGPPNYNWAGWSSLGGFLTGDVAVAANQDGRLQVFARGKDGMLGYTYQTTASNSTAWSAWTSLGVVITSAPAVALNSDGRMEVFARGLDGTLGHIAQTAASGATSWGTWESLGGKEVITSRPAAAQNNDGRLEVLARGPEGGLRAISQTAAGGATGWSTWLSLGGATIGDPSVARLQDGRLVAFVRKTEDSSVRNIYQSAAGSWVGSTWESRGGTVLCDPVVVCRPEGRLEAWAVGADNGLWTVWQTAANSAWQPWTNLGGTITMFPSTTG